MLALQSLKRCGVLF